MKRRTSVILVAAAGLTAAFTAHAGEIGHFNGAVMNIRDYVMPDPGWYTAIYNYFYMTDQLNNSNGDAINSVIIKPSPRPWNQTGRGCGREPVRSRANTYLDHRYQAARHEIWCTDLAVVCEC